MSVDHQYEDWLKIEDNECRFRTPSLITRRRRLVGGIGFEKMGVASWHIRTLSHQIPSTVEQVCPYSH